MTKSADNRIAANTPPPVNRRIEWETEERLAFYAAHPHHIPARLDELEREWDIERALITNASSLGLVGLLLGFFVKRSWLLLPLVVAAFLLQHGLQGWCPPLPLFRRLGIRTKEEILHERTILRALRGDLDGLCASRGQTPQDRFAQVLAVVSE
jgi:hypothetical protein